MPRLPERLEDRWLLTFAAPVNYPLTGQPSSMVEGDFTGDGKLDLVTNNNFSSSGLDILLGNGDGTFQPPVNFDHGLYFSSLVVGDFNRDGKLDIAALVNVPNQSVAFLMGNGDGTFQPPVYSDAGPLDAIAAGDINGDGKLDLVGVNPLAQSVNVLLGNGDGTFQTPVSYPVGQIPGAAIVGGITAFGDSITLRDLNGDGKLDIVTTNINVQDVSVLLGNADGTFGPSASYDIEQPAAAAYDRQHEFFNGGPQSVAIGDLNGDGKQDLVVANLDAQDVSVLLGNADGTFQPAVNVAVGGRPTSVTLGDFNHDGQLDIATSNLSNTVSVLYGRGDGTFQPHADFATDQGPRVIVGGDFNGDGTVDLATANFSFVNTVAAGSSVSVLLNQPTPNERFIGNVYHQLLGRQVDTGAMLFWSNALEQGGSRQKMVLTLEASLEYRADEVRALYQRYLRRDPDASGWQFFTNSLLQGGSVEQVAATLIGSLEYMEGVVAPQVIVTGQPPDDGFVEKLFRDALGRDVDRATLTMFDNLIAEGFSHRQIAALVLESPEYETALVQGFYQQFLHRDADPSGLKAATDALAGGSFDEQVIAMIVASDEYFRLLGA